MNKLQILLFKLENSEAQSSGEELTKISDEGARKLTGGTTNATCGGNSTCSTNESCTGNYGCQANESCSGNTGCMANNVCKVK